MGQKQINPGVSVACVDLRSAFNTGSIFRTADAAAVDTIYLCGYTPFPPHSKLEKTSRGTHEHVDWEYRSDIGELIKEQQSRGVHVMAAETSDRAVNYRNAHFPKPLLLVFGNEARGLPVQVLDMCDSITEIPMKGWKNSLNVAVAAGIIIFHASCY